MKKFKITYNRKNCIGAASCAIVCPKFWKIADDGKADLLGSKKNPKNNNHELNIEVNNEDLKSLREAAASCPVQVIKIE